MAVPWEDLVAGVKKGNLRALARMISRVENRDSGWRDAMKAIYPETGATVVFGITGAPGAGKSTLTNKIAQALVARGFKVGIIAVDPSSPFSGGALLGDRLRMQEIATLEGVFIRSMATRGTLGGLCQGARDVIRIMDAFGKDIVLIETVGVGQDEIEVVRAADFVLVVSVPGLGDGIQTLKAGIMEIADLFVVNKADREGTDKTFSDLRLMIEMDQKKYEDGSWKPPILKAQAVFDIGVKELLEEIDKHNRYLTKFSGERQVRRREDKVREELGDMIKSRLIEEVLDKITATGDFDKAVESIVEGKTDPYTACDNLVLPAIGGSTG